MTDFDLHVLSMVELRKLEKDVAKAIASYEEQQKVKARAEVETVARTFGYSLAELVDVVPQKKRGPVAAKYQHPENPDLTWSGRGRKPVWIAEGLAAGKVLEDFAI